MADFLSPTMSVSECADVANIGRESLQEWRKRGLLEGIGQKSGVGRQAWVHYSLHDALVLFIAGRLLKSEIGERIRIGQIVAEELVKQFSGRAQQDHYVVFFDSMDMEPQHFVTSDFGSLMERTGHLIPDHIQVVDLRNLRGRLPAALLNGLRSLRPEG